MLTKERKRVIQNASLKPQKEGWKTKLGTKKKGNGKKMVTNMLDVYPTVSIY